MPYRIAPEYKTELDDQFISRWLTHPKSTAQLKAAISIYLGKGIDVIKAALDAVEDKANLNKRFSEYKLSLLHLAVITHQLDVVKLLIGKVDLNKQDVHDWTALHHAAIQSDSEIYEFLISEGANQDILNDRNGSAKHLYDMSHLPSTPADQVVTYVQDGDDIRPLSASEFKQRTGCSYSDNVYNPQSLLIDWIDKDHSLKEALEYANECLTCLPQLHTPKSDCFYITNQYQTDSGELVTTIGDLLVANKDIPPNTIFTYAGEVTIYEETEDVDYYLMGVNANGPNKLRNIGPIVADSFPNSLYTVRVNHDGVLLRPVIRTLTMIPKGRAILVDYGTQNIKVSGHIELSKKELLAFVNEKSISDRLERFSANSQHWRSTDINIILESARLVYISHTPSSMIYLFFMGKFTNSDLQSLYNDSVSRTSRLEESYNRFVILFERYNNLSASMQKIFTTFMLWRISLDDINLLFYYITELDILIDMFKNCEHIPDSDHLNVLQETMSEFCDDRSKLTNQIFPEIDEVHELVKTKTMSNTELAKFAFGKQLFAAALNFFQASLADYDENSIELTTCYYNIASSFDRLELSEEAIKYCKIAYNLRCELLGDQDGSTLSALKKLNLLKDKATQRQKALQADSTCATDEPVASTSISH